MRPPHDPQGSDHLSPVNPLPPVVLALFLIILGIECVFFLGGEGIVGGPAAIGWRLSALQKYAFSGQILSWMMETGRWPVKHLIRFVSYPFIHTAFNHAVFAGVILLAMGKFVAEAYGGFATLILFVVSAIGGALVFGLIQPDLPLIGAFPAVYGLIGGYTYLSWRYLDQIGAQQLRAFYLIGFLMAFQLLFGLLFGTSPTWIADLSGFVTGFLCAVLLAPGGLAALLARIRRD